MSALEFFTPGVFFVLCDQEDSLVSWCVSATVHAGNVDAYFEQVRASKGFVGTTLFAGTYRVQVTTEEVAIPVEMSLQEDMNVYFPTGNLLRHGEAGEGRFVSVGSVPAGHYQALLYWSWSEDNKHMGLARSEYPEGDGPDGIIVLRRLQRDVWMGDVLEFFTRTSGITVFDEADAERSLGYAWTPAIAGTYFVHLGLEDRVTPSAEMKVLDRRNVRFKTGRLRQSSGDMIGTIPPGYYEAILYGSETAPSEDPGRVLADAVIVLRPRIPVG